MQVNRQAATEADGTEQNLEMALFFIYETMEGNVTL